MQFLRVKNKRKNAPKKIITKNTIAQNQNKGKITLKTLDLTCKLILEEAPLLSVRAVLVLQPFHFDPALLRINLTRVDSQNHHAPVKQEQNQHFTPPPSLGKHYRKIIVTFSFLSV